MTDEGFEVINARNLILLGDWSTNDWNLHLVNVPFSLAVAAAFLTFGVGIVQARIVSIVAISLAVAALGAGLRRSLGAGAALLGASAVAGSALVLYYGRLAYLEDFVALGLALGLVGVLRIADQRAGWWGFASGFALAIAIGAKPSAAFAVSGLLLGVTAAVWRPSTAARSWIAGAVAAIALSGLAWMLVIGLPHWQQVATDLRIWAPEPLPTSWRALIQRITSFPFRSDGMVLLAAPLLVAGIAGAVVATRHVRHLPLPARGLLGAAMGCLVLGYGILAIVPYRPNRYEVPLLPALGVLVALGWSALAERWRPRAAARLKMSLASGTIAVALTLPGLVMFGSWMDSTPTTLPSIQAQVAAMIPSDEAVEGGLADTFALRAPVVTLITNPATGLNTGDLYANRHVRWYIDPLGAQPSWATLHPVVWASRTERLCVLWVNLMACVWQVP